MLDVFSAVIIILGLATLLIGSYTDLKTREVPDWLSFSLIAAAIAIRIIYSFIRWDYWPLLYGIFGLAIFVAISLLMFYTAQWGGGDAKLLMGLGALFGFDLRFSSILASFILALIVVGAVYGLIWSLSLALLHWKEFSKRFHHYMHEKKHFRIRLCFFSAATIMLIAAFFLADSLIRLMLVSIIILFYIIFYLYIFIKAIEEVCMIKDIPVSRLTEGDWIVNEIKHGKELIASPKDLGISKEQIAKLKQAGIKRIIIKEGIPFVPSFLLAFIFALVFGNIFMLMAI